MKKYLSILAIILMCAFLFVSCDDFDLGALGGILGDLTGELLSGDEETPDYSNPGGATAAELEGTWTGSSTSFNDKLELVDSAVTVTIGEGKFSRIEKDMNGDVLISKEGDLITDKIGEGLIGMSLPTVTDPDKPTVGYISLKESDVDGADYLMIDIFDEQYIGDPEAKYTEIKVDGSDLVSSSEHVLLGELSSSIRRYSDELLSNSDFVLSQYNSDKTEDGKVTLQIREHSIRVHVEDRDEAEGELLRLKYTETECLSNTVSYWFRYTKETDTLELYYGGEPLKLTRGK
jgi:hypothetical protein